MILAQARHIEQPRHDDRAQLILDAFAGNALAALNSVIADADWLCHQLETATENQSFGYVRGLKPKFDREG
ncbi:hypothetical protein [Neorhizobium alkalisoli]|uniref:hypothetical protein n=1 Tax=Neorhizobium alkalisoli TaxID=528178 RepID=UPI0011A6694C|nr:hypothetical protein [Neorhizobium alkalisoli]